MAWADFQTMKDAADILRRSMERDRLGHAYLMTGVDLGALENFALNLAKTLNCHEPPLEGNDSCDHCVSCRKISEGIHADVMAVRPESKLRQIRIAQITRRQNSPARVLHDLVYNTPAEGEWKVALIVAADRMNRDAANAFLKSLEEPPKRTLFLLLSTEPGRLLDTIRSRCMQLNCSGDGVVPMGEGETAWLREFAGRAGQGQAGVPGRYRLLATLLERLAEIKKTIEQELTEASPLKQHEEIPPDLREQWEKELNAAVESEYRHQRAGYLAALQGWLRDVWILNSGVPADLAVFPDLAQAADTVAGRLSPAEAVGNLAILEQTQRALNTTVNELLILEVGMLKLRL
jgi:DNA polymerase-3 subunit delta'